MAEYLVHILLDKGFVIQRYDAITTNSIYLKLDYGVCNSIRISDHKGKKHLSYRYVIGFDIKECRVDQKDYERRFYPANEYKKLLEDIYQDKQSKLKSYGYLHYRQFMKNNKLSNQGKRGFWSEAKTLLPKTEKMKNEV